MQLLQANTAVDVLIGPFLDTTNGNDTEEGLTIEDEHVLLSKNGQALAAKTDANDATHDDLGYYNCPLDTTDTNTEGTLDICCHMSGALAVRHQFMVISQAAWDSLFAAKDTGYMDMHVKTVEAGIIANASLNADVGSTAYATNVIALAVRKVLDELNLDHLLAVAVSDRDNMPEVVDDTILANIMTKTDGDTSDFDHATDSLEALRDHIGDGTNLTEAGGDGDHLTEAGGDGDHLVEVAPADGALTDAKFGADCITNAKIADNALNTEQFAADFLDSTLIADDALVAANFATACLTDDAFAADALVAATFATGALTADAFAANALVAATFNADCITAAKVAADVHTENATAVWASSNGTLTKAYSLIMEQIYQFLHNDMNITDATGAVALRNLANDGDMATWGITDNDTTTARTDVVWA